MAQLETTDDTCRGETMYVVFENRYTKLFPILNEFKFEEKLAMVKLIYIPYLVVICVISLFAVTPVHSENKIVMKTIRDKVVVKTVCIEGLLFVVAAHGGRKEGGRGVAIVQVYDRDKNTATTQPKKCDD